MHAPPGVDLIDGVDSFWRIIIIDLLAWIVSDRTNVKRFFRRIFGRGQDRAAAHSRGQSSARREFPDAFSQPKTPGSSAVAPGTPEPSVPARLAATIPRSFVGADEEVGMCRRRRIHVNIVIKQLGPTTSRDRYNCVSQDFGAFAFADRLGCLKATPWLPPMACELHKITVPQ